MSSLALFRDQTVCKALTVDRKVISALPYDFRVDSCVQEFKIWRCDTRETELKKGPRIGEDNRNSGSNGGFVYT